MDSATKAAWLAAAGAAVAALFAIWSAWSSHRSARSAAGTLAIERDREHDRLTPRIQVKEATHPDKREGLWFTNDGPLDYTSVRFRAETPNDASPLDGLEIDGTWIPANPELGAEGDLGRMALGDRRFVACHRADPMRGTTLRLRITCSSDRDSWLIYREVEFLPPPFAIR
jgi:hypothetical protein